MTDTIFTKIIKGEVPSYKVYQDDKTIAFIPLHIIGKATVLVVPTAQVDAFMDLSNADYQALMGTVKKVARRMRDVYKTKELACTLKVWMCLMLMSKLLLLILTLNFMTNQINRMSLNY
jgi:diadenosine tetraphosphate (Ap4A) HIT family hydrolase